LHDGIFFYIGLGAGLAAACGLRPFLPVLLAGALGSAGALGVGFTSDPFRFLQASWWLLIVAVALVVAYVLQLVFGLSPSIDLRGRSRADPSPHRSPVSDSEPERSCSPARSRLTANSPWPGVLGGLLVVGLAQRVCGPVLAGARARLADRAAREALTVYLDAASLALAALVALLHPLGYLVSFCSPGSCGGGVHARQEVRRAAHPAALMPA